MDELFAEGYHVWGDCWAGPWGASWSWGPQLIFTPGLLLRAALYGTPQDLVLHRPDWTSSALGPAVSVEMLCQRRYSVVSEYGMPPSALSSLCCWVTSTDFRDVPVL